ncbi:MAG TPA: protoglobin domain-containing protein, partial [Leptospiraceae bacterium]|nr:protoglobin domain-containing protein [Leptospiraceae bacterium]
MNFFRTSSAETAVFQKSDLHLNEPYFSFAEFSGLTLENLNAVSEIREMLNSKIESVTDLHYEYILNSKALKKIIDDHSTLEKLKKTFREYLKSLFSGKIDEEYCRKRQIIGTVHYNIKLYPEWYIGAQGRILDVLIPMLTDRIRDRKKLSFALVSLNKLIHFDSQIILKSYSEMFTYRMNETLCSAVERTADSRNIEAVVNTKEKIQNTVNTLEKIKSNMDLSRNDWKKSEKEFTFLLQESDRSLLDMKITRDRISESLSSIEKISSSYRELVKNWSGLNRE